jgi:hypothetical protein
MEGYRKPDAGRPGPAASDYGLAQGSSLKGRHGVVAVVRTVDLIARDFWS